MADGKPAGQHVKILVPEGHKHRDEDSPDDDLKEGRISEVPTTPPSARRDTSVSQTVSRDGRSSEVPTTSQSQRVDISRIQSAYSERCHSRSNFPDVLSEYGDEEDTRVREKENKKKKKKVKSKDHDEEELREKRRKRREERYMNVMDEISNKPEGSQYYSKKVSGIAIAVQKYEQMNKPATPRTPRTPRSSDDEEPKREIPRFKPKKEKHVLTSNTEHLKHISKTDIAKIIELQDRLIREGKLRTQADIDKFREDVKNPMVLSSYLRSTKKTDKSSESTQQGDVSTVGLPPGIPGRSLSHISERSSRPITRQDGWAITQQFQHKHDQSTKQNLSPVQLAKQAAQDLDKRFPKTQMPPLKCFTIDLGEKPPDPEEIKKEIELKVRVKQRKKFLRKLHRMHQLSMANNAATNRILEKHDDIMHLLEGNSLRDVVSVLPAPEDAYISQDDLRVPDPGEQFANYYDNMPPSRASLRSKLDSQKGSRESLVSRESLASRSSSKESGLRRRHTFNVKQASIAEKIPPIPLTMDEIRSNAKIMEAKCLSSYWTNYMKAGKKTEIF
ncbi:hypothetical protein FSP39_006262 [Pinctada imbricata]|uniref:Uncharacterized protein n=1 Tax=Pinctada imbricata TaxID=66713 RepID=A0AA88Y9E5_PINIB|nr:hypothetical protein FSP39_006262 [Pinctada imbricata]